MAIKYYVREIKNPRNAAETRYMAQYVTDGQVSQQSIIDRIVEKSSLAEGDVLSCVTEVFKEIATEVLEGHSVKLENFGIFYPSLTCKSQAKPEDVTADTIESVHLSFRPATRWYEGIKPKTRFTRVAAPVKDKKKGGASSKEEEGSNGDTRGDGDGMEM